MQSPYPIVTDAKRLAALETYNILDTPPEPEFDDIVALTREICEVPVAIISLIGKERQWFKARVGLEERETPIAVSLCTHALAAGTTLVIPDLTVDERTKDNPLVVGGPMVRFYAGALLRTMDNEILGTLCIIDMKPRPTGLTGLQLDALQMLARQVMTTLELRRMLHLRDQMVQDAADIARSEIETAARVTAAQEAGHIGTFDIDLDTDEAAISSETCRIFGLPVATSYPASVLTDQIIQTPERLVETNAARHAGTAPAETTYKIRRADNGAIRWIWRGGRFVTDKNGKPLRFFGSLKDITERKVGELRLGALTLLGDMFRKTGEIGEMVSAATIILGENLDAYRVGYAMADTVSQTFSVEPDWTARNARSLAGTHDCAGLENTLERLSAGAPVVIDNVAIASWLKSDTKIYEEIGAKAQIIIPLIERGMLVGILFVHDNRVRAWSSDELDFVLEVADRVYAAAAKVRAEEDQALLNEELSHRLKNTLALVQAIVTQTLQKSVDPTVLKSFTDRIFALSAAHDILLQKSWVSARIFDVIRDTLILQFPATRFSMIGPNLNLAPQAALSLSLLMHELATNAVKYGAISKPGGVVTIEWKVDPASASEFMLEWKERGGPPATEPQQSGFGSRLIKSGLLGTRKAELSYATEGFTAVFRAPLSNTVNN